MEIEVNYLLDTNIGLERLLDQEKLTLVADFLDRIASSNISISDFALHSIGVILTKLNKLDILIKLVNDLFINGMVEVLSLGVEDIETIKENIITFNLDFDDSYQYTLAKKYGLTLVTFDSDFNQTEINVKTPDQVHEQQ